MIIPAELVSLCYRAEKAGHPLSAVYADVARQRVIASNGKALAVLPLEEILPEEVSGFVSPAAILYARKYTRGVLLCLADYVEIEGVHFPHPVVDRPFPDWEALIPPPGGQEIWLDAQLLMQIAQALYQHTHGPMYVCLRWVGEGHDEPAEVLRYEGTADAGQGLLMLLGANQRMGAPVPLVEEQP